MKNEPTPGNWELKGSEIRVYGRGIIAIVPSPKDGGVMECVANARVLSAALDMLVALQELASEARSACDARQFPSLTNALAEADYAIRKAEQQP